MMGIPQGGQPAATLQNVVGARQIFRGVELEVDSCHGCGRFMTMLSGNEIHSLKGLLHRVRIDDDVNQTGSQILDRVGAEIMHNLGQ